MTSAAPGESAPRAHKLRSAHWRLAVAALTRVLAGEPADAVMRETFRAAPQCGTRDRANVSALVYGVLRDYRGLAARGGADAIALCALQVLRSGAADGATLVSFGVEAAPDLAGRATAELALAPAIEANVPDEAWTRWCARFGADEARALARALDREGNVDLRVNLLKATRDQARMALAAAGIEATPTPLSPWGLRLARRAALQATAPFRDGWIEPQDEGSQLLVQLCAPAPGSIVVDYCAGAGGKTLALAAAMGNRGRIVAGDSDAARLARMAPRLARAGASIVETRVLRGASAPDDLHDRADLVLVDAPCSASGTWRRNPELRLRPLRLDANATLQLHILEAASALVRGGGRLVYATCSLFEEENQTVVAGFLAGHPEFAPVEVELPGLPPAPSLQLLPHRHDTDGFFAATLRRRESPQE